MDDLTTDRLRLRPFTDDDAPFVLEVHRHPDLVRFIPSAACETLDDARALIERFTFYDGDPVLGIPLVELHDGTPVGLVMLKPIPPSGRGLAATARPEPGDHWDIEIGWRVHPDHEGRGYVTEAARAVLDHAFGRGPLRVLAVTDPENERSQRVAERIGMERRGRSSDYYDEELELFEATIPEELLSGPIPTPDEPA